MAINWNVDNKTGTDCSGSDGESNRVLTLSNSSLTIQSEFNVYVSGLELTLTTEYTVVHNVSGTQITFLNPLWNDLTVIVRFSQGLTNFGDLWGGNSYFGSDCSGSDGDSNRVITLDNVTRTTQTGFMVFVDGLCLAEGTEYTAVHQVGSQVTFLNGMWNDMIIEVLWLQFSGIFEFTETLRLLDIKQIAISRSISDTLLLSDNFSKVFPLVLRTLTEIINLNDVKKFDISHKLIDILLLQDNLAISKELYRTLTDTLVLSDEIILSDIYRVILTDTLNLSDELFHSDIYRVILSDNLKLLDSIKKDDSRTLSEIINLGDAIYLSRLITLLESLLLSDSIKKSTDKKLNDLLLLSDSKSFISGRLFSEAFYLTDSVNKGISKTLSDLLYITDFCEGHGFLRILLQEYLLLNDYFMIGFSPELILLADEISPLLLSTESVLPIQLLADEIIPTLLDLK